MAINWDPIINGGVLISVVIWFASLLTKQTLPEMIQTVMDLINGTKDDVLEKGEELVYYD